MRIVAGTHRGRALMAPAGDATRPTADRVRQALFDILLHAPWGGRALFDGATVLDGFAGSGALGIEALSRGAAHAVFIERDRRALDILHRNLFALGLADRATVLAADLLSPPRGRPVALALLDPPYAAGLVPDAVASLADAGWIDARTVIAAEFSRAGALPALGSLLADRTHGAARLAIWRAAPEKSLTESESA